MSDLEMLQELLHTAMMKKRGSQFPQTIAEWEGREKALERLIALVLLRAAAETNGRLTDEEFERCARDAADGERTQNCVREARRARAAELVGLERTRVLESRLTGIARAATNLALATPDKVLRAELERAAKLAIELLPKSES